QRDFDLASSVGVDYLFVPSVEEMYPDGFSTKIIVTKFTDKFEGLKRIGHFDGVATVVAKIFNVTKPNVAIFGQKDFQQILVVRQLVKDLLFDIEIVIAPTVRENDGLAMSSRNIYLSKEEREVASQIYQALLKGVEAINKHITNRKVISSIVQEHLAKFPQFVVDYVAVVNSENLSEPEEFKSGENVVILVAVFLGNTRLIDNLVATIP
ncbi:MAG: 4-phosphopantoate--beta-alanine ligase, partial [Candidatus Kapaibacteriota bacterium]